MPWTPTEFDGIRWQIGKGTNIPAWGVAKVSSTSQGQRGQTIFSVIQPDGADGVFCINGPFAAKSYGRVTFDAPVYALIDTGSPAIDDVWIPKSGQWSLTKLDDAVARDTEFYVVGSSLSDPYRVPVIPQTAVARMIYGTLAGSLTAGGSVSCNVSRCLNGFQPSAATVTVHDALYGTLTGSSGNNYVAIEDLYAGQWDFLGIICGG